MRIVALPSACGDVLIGVHIDLLRSPLTLNDFSDMLSGENALMGLDKKKTRWHLNHFFFRSSFVFFLYEKPYGYMTLLI